MDKKMFDLMKDYITLYIAYIDTNLYYDYVWNSLENTKKELENMGINVVILGDGDKIIKQYPSQDNIIYKGDRVFLLTNNYDKRVPNLIGYSYKEVISLLKLMDINYTINGNGYVYEQSILEGNIISDEDNLVINLKPKY